MLLLIRSSYKDVIVLVELRHKPLPDLTWEIRKFKGDQPAFITSFFPLLLNVRLNNRTDTTSRKVYAMLRIDIFAFTDQ
jgi:hypothetical protein